MNVYQKLLLIFVGTAQRIRGITVDEVARRTVARGISRATCETEAARSGSRATAGLAILIYCLAVSISTLASN